MFLPQVDESQAFMHSHPVSQSQSISWLLTSHACHTKASLHHMRLLGGLPLHLLCAVRKTSAPFWPSTSLLENEEHNCQLTLPSVKAEEKTEMGLVLWRGG